MIDTRTRVSRSGLYLIIHPCVEFQSSTWDIYFAWLWGDLHRTNLNWTRLGGVKFWPRVCDLGLIKTNPWNGSDLRVLLSRQQESDRNKQTKADKRQGCVVGCQSARLRHFKSLQDTSSRGETSSGSGGACSVNAAMKSLLPLKAVCGNLISETSVTNADWSAGVHMH